MTDQPDVFVSYAQDDRKLARQVVDRLQREDNTSVFWDYDIAFAEHYDAAIDRSLRAAKCVVVLWTKTSVARPWVRAEARVALADERLLPVIVGGTTVPVEFSGVNGLVVDRTLAGIPSEDLDRIAEAATDLLHGRRMEQRQPSRFRQRRLRRRRLRIAGLALAVATGGLVWNEARERLNVTRATVGRTHIDAAAGLGELWVTADNDVWRRNLATKATQQFDVGGPAREVDVSSDGIVAISLADRSDVAIIEDDTVQAPIDTGGYVADIALARGALWAVDSKAGRVTRTDVQSRTQAGHRVAGAHSVAANDEFVYVVAGGAEGATGSLLKFDAATGEFVAAASTAGAEPIGIEVADGQVWVTDERSGEIAVHDASTLDAKAKVGVGTLLTDVAFDGRWVWAASRGSAEVVAFDPRTMTVHRRVKLADRPFKVDSTGGALWVASPGAIYQVTLR